SRSGELVRNFTGQWLQARDVQNIAIDVKAVLARDNAREKVFHDGATQAAENEEQKKADAAQANGQAHGLRRFRPKDPPVRLDGDLRQAMRTETEMFFSSVIKDNSDLATLIDSDYTFLNEKLATIYGLASLNVHGNEMRRVTLPPDCARGGLITEGTV